MNIYDRARAREYEKVYGRADALRQSELLHLREAMTALFRGKTVLEVACGTGYWTQFLATVVSHVVAVDACRKVLQVAKEKSLDSDKVTFWHGDGYRLDAVPGHFNGGVANFWFSHVPKARVPEFLTHFHARLNHGAAVFMADNVYTEGVGGELVTKKGDTNTYKVRIWENGRSYEVLKNYYGKDALRSIFDPYCYDSPDFRWPILLVAILPAAMKSIVAKAERTWVKGSDHFTPVSKRLSLRCFFSRRQVLDYEGP